jgi:hypothetical protein
MRRFDQIIRQAGHFGKQPPRVNTAHQNRHSSFQLEKHCFPRGGVFRRAMKGNSMFDTNNDLELRRILTFVFAVASGMSAVCAAVCPAIF